MKVVRERDATFVPRKFVAGRGCLLHFLCPARVLAIAGCVTWIPKYGTYQKILANYHSGRVQTGKKKHDAAFEWYDKFEDRAKGVGEDRWFCRSTILTKLREQLPKHVNNPHPEEEAEGSSSELIPTAESQDDTAEPVKELPPDTWSALLAMMTWSISTSASTLRSQWTLKLTSFMLLTHVWTPFSSSQMFRTRKAVCLHYWKCRLADPFRSAAAGSQTWSFSHWSLNWNCKPRHLQIHVSTHPK